MTDETKVISIATKKPVEKVAESEEQENNTEAQKGDVYQQATITLLESALELAKKGELRGVSIIGERSDKSILRFVQIPPNLEDALNHCFKFKGALGLVEKDYDAIISMMYPSITVSAK